MYLAQVRTLTVYIPHPFCYLSEVQNEQIEYVRSAHLKL